MKGTEINFTDNADNVIAVIGIVISTLFAVYEIVKSTKKYELTESYRKELLEWYTSVVNLMMRIIHYSESGDFFAPGFSAQKTEMLSQFSALIEVGRFYFPNIVKDDNFGSRKSIAYQGYRHVTLEFLMYFYRAASNDNVRNIDTLRVLERKFTSQIFEMIDPRSRVLDYSKYLALTIPEGQSIEEYLEKHPEDMDIFEMY